MKALVFQGPGQKALLERPKPVIQGVTDALVRITRTTICGTDLHILKGDVASCARGRILGHEGVGVIEEVGAAVSRFRRGDRVLVSCISSCGRCDYCRRGMYSHCETGGWILGNTIDGTQAEFVRIPHADTSLYPIPADVDEEALVMLSDILPTGFECGVLNGKVQPGNTIAIIGAGPVGLTALLTAQFYSPAEIIMVDLDDHRLAIARQFGATHTIRADEPDLAARIFELTDGKGVDTAIEAVGVPSTFEFCEEIIAAGGVIANIGVHGLKADLHLEKLWSRNIAITTRLVDTTSTPMLLRTVKSGLIDAGKLITHRFKLDDILEAYETFSRAASTHALKVIIEMPAAQEQVEQTDDGKAVAEGRAPDTGVILSTRMGLLLDVRPVRNDDEPHLAELFRHVTPQDLRFRFFGGIGEVSHERLASMTLVDHRLTENYLAFLEGTNTLVASALLACDDAEKKAEVAIVVHGEYKNKGVAWELLRYVSNRAREKGVQTLQSIENRNHIDAVRLEQEQGFVARPYEDDPTLVLIEKNLQ
ncbi:GNAT family N-acetyltransferase [Agrobacterium tumefaciens]|uniref:GNAT family N-acetyltransferase n=2 Tax=Rhizobium/Agrobacterium group TaxID=227290 RepID=A0A4D7YIZ1_AGRTU|nr:GNAT family N-acetyltransferase [Agrobacterium tumefaciens]